jgi:beta-fructofuranosidase
MKPNSGTHYMVADHPLGPFHQPEHDVLFGDEQGSAYAGKLIQDKDGQWVLMTSIVYNSSGVYVGDISNPLPINFQKNGEMSIRQDPTYQ